MGIHREGYASIAIAAVIAAALIVAAHALGAGPWGKALAWGLGLFLLVTMLQFFRRPLRHVPVNEAHALAPADGKVVAIEEVQEEEFFHDTRLQVSIFMSPVNVHVNWAPVAGKVSYARYHPGRYLVAWHPKSSTDNERTTVVFAAQAGPVMVRQIAGALARRIACYAKEGEHLEQGQEMGFIKFGSRVDVLLPKGATPTVQLGQRVKGAETVIAQF